MSAASLLSAPATVLRVMELRDVGGGLVAEVDGRRAGFVVGTIDEAAGLGVYHLLGPDLRGNGHQEVGS